MMSFVPENRRNARHFVGVSVRLFLDSPQTGMRAEIVDMSAGGMRIRAPGLELAPNQQMTLRIARHDGHAATTPLEELWLLRWHNEWVPTRVMLPQE